MSNFRFSASRRCFSLGERDERGGRREEERGEGGDVRVIGEIRGESAGGAERLIFSWQMSVQADFHDMAACAYDIEAGGKR